MSCQQARALLWRGRRCAGRRRAAGGNSNGQASKRPGQDSNQNQEFSIFEDGSVVSHGRASSFFGFTDFIPVCAAKQLQTLQADSGLEAARKLMILQTGIFTYPRAAWHRDCSRASEVLLCDTLLQVSRHRLFQLTPGNRSNSCYILPLQTAKNFIN